MNTIGSLELITGVAVGATLAGALLASTIFRGLALSAMAAVIIRLYLLGGIPGLLDGVKSLQGEFNAHMGLAYGLAAGVAGIVILTMTLQKRH